MLPSLRYNYSKSYYGMHISSTVLGLINSIASNIVILLLLYIPLPKTIIIFGKILECLHVLRRLLRVSSDSCSDFLHTAHVWLTLGQLVPNSPGFR